VLIFEHDWKYTYEMYIVHPAPPPFTFLNRPTPCVKFSLPVIDLVLRNFSGAIKFVHSLLFEFAVWRLTLSQFPENLQYSNIPQYLKRVAILPCDMSTLDKKAVLSQRWPRSALYTGALKIFSSSSSHSPDPNRDRIPKLNLDASRLQM